MRPIYQIFSIRIFLDSIAEVKIYFFLFNSKFYINFIFAMKISHKISSYFK